MKAKFILTAAALCALGTLTPVAESAIAPGDLVIFRAGTGAAALGASSTAAFLDEYTPAGVFVQSIPLPTSGGSALTVVGNATTEGIISPSQDGSRLVFTGYRNDAGLGSATATAKVIGTVDLTGVPDTSVAVTDAGTVTARSATTVDGTTYYLATSGAVRYVGTPGGAATSVVVDARNSRQVNLYDSNLYASNGSTAVTAKVQSYGSLPTGSTVPTAVVTLTTADAVNGFFMADLNPGVAGVDTVYALSTVENLLRKYTFDGTNWTSNGSIPASSTLNLTGVVNGTDVQLYLTSAGSLYAYLDTSGVGGSLSGTLGAAIATAGTNTAFRGIGILVPEPGSIMLLGLGGLVLVRRRR